MQNWHVHRFIIAQTCLIRTTYVPSYFKLCDHHTFVGVLELITRSAVNTPCLLQLLHKFQNNPQPNTTKCLRWWGDQRLWSFGRCLGRFEGWRIRLGGKLHGKDLKYLFWCIGLYICIYLYILYPDMRSMYGIFTCIYHTNQLNGGKYAIHGSYRIYIYMYFFYLSIL